MPYTVDFLKDEGIVLIENTGKLTYEDFAKQGQEATELGRVNSTGLFLADCTRLTAQVKTLEVLDLPALYERIGAPRTNKVAVLISEDAATNKDIGFYETVCRNRGWQIRVFNAKDAAVEWLLSGKAKSRTRL